MASLPPAPPSPSLPPPPDSAPPAPPSSTPSPPPASADPPPPAETPPLPGPASGEKTKEDDVVRMAGSGSREALMGGKSRPRNNPANDVATKFFQNLVAKVTSKKHSKRGVYYTFTTQQVFFTLNAVRRVFSGEPAMIEMKLPCIVVGDIHGQFTDLCRIFDTFRTPDSPGYYTTRYVFLGDYVDRGRQSLEVVLVLFMLKCLYPSQFALLRGNHECRAINKAYGFFAEIKERFFDPKVAAHMFDSFNDVFSHMPLSCLVANHILCMHGGISSKMKTRNDLLNIPKPLKDVSTNQIATDLLWADPMLGLTKEIPNKVRGVSVYFGENTLDQVMKDLDLKLVFRGHQMMMNGFNFFHTKLVTVFSAAAYYPEKPNRGAVAIVSLDGRVGFKSYMPGKPTPEDKPKLFRGDHDTANDFDNGYVKVAPGMPQAQKPQENSSENEEKQKA